MLQNWRVEQVSLHIRSLYSTWVLTLFTLVRKIACENLVCEEYVEIVCYKYVLVIIWATNISEFKVINHCVGSRTQFSFRQRGSRRVIEALAATPSSTLSPLPGCVVAQILSSSREIADRVGVVEELVGWCWVSDGNEWPRCGLRQAMQNSGGGDLEWWSSTAACSGQSLERRVSVHGHRQRRPPHQTRVWCTTSWGLEIDWQNKHDEEQNQS